MLSLTKSSVRACLLCVIAGLATTELSAAPSSRWLAKLWTVEDGLPNNTIHGVAQTTDGYLWLATPTGLVRFDGVNFVSFASTNFVEAPNRGVLAMLRLQTGGLALVMDRGALVMLHRNSTKVYFPVRDLPDESWYALVQDEQGGLWISYRGGAVRRIANGEIENMNEKGGLPSEPGNCALAVDTKGEIWYALGNDFGVYRDGKFQKRESVPTSYNRLATASDGGIWICSGSQILKYNDGTGLSDKGSFSKVRASPRALLEDQSGQLWIGTAYGGLFQYSESGFETVPISHKEVTSLIEDHEGNIWAGTTGGGLNQVRPRIVELEGTDAGLPFEGVQSLAEDTNGTLWATAQNGAIARRVNNRWEHFVPEGWTAEALCVAVDYANVVWFGSRLNGLFRWQDGKLTNWGETNGLKGRTIHALQPSREGMLWIGEDTPNALQALQDGQIKNVEIPESDLRVIRAMTESTDGSVWVGTSRGLLLKIHNGKVTDETSRTMSEPTSIRTLYASPDGAVWVGYAGWGVGRIANGKFAGIREEQGLFDDYISQIVADDFGWMWFGGDRGVFKVRQKELEDVAEGRATKVRSIHYGRGEGLPSVQANVGSAPGAIKSQDGRVWIPMRTALAVAHPERLRQSAEPPQVLLHRVVVDEQTVAIDSGIMPLPENNDSRTVDLQKFEREVRLQPGHRRLQFQFTAPSYTAPENVRFRYQLEGYDEDWVEGSSDRVATYSRLPAGKYRFHVIACNSDDVWNERGRFLQVAVAPFFWNTWLFRLAAGTAFTLLIIGIVRYVSFRRLRLQLQRLEEQEALHKERARIAKDIHDDVGANLTQIALLGDLARQDSLKPEESAPRLETISRTARQAVKSLDEIVWAVNPRNDTLAHLIDYTGQFAVDYLRVAGVRCRLDLPEHTPEREVSTDIRHNLFLVVKEALNNIVKHSHATEVWLRISADERELRIGVEDNGVGFEGQKVEAGADGLRNMRQRITDIGGQFKMESRTGGGTKVFVEVKWSPSENGHY